MPVRGRGGPVKLVKRLQQHVCCPECDIGLGVWGFKHTLRLARCALEQSRYDQALRLINRHEVETF